MIGTGNGNILMYNPVTRKLVPILGKHPKEISCGDWTSSGILALGSVDGAVTFSEKAGTTINQVPIGIQVHFFYMCFYKMVLNYCLAECYAFWIA